MAQAPTWGAWGHTGDHPCLILQYEESVNENEVGVLVARLHVTDQDLLGSPAWRAVYRIQSGDPQGNFEITTDPKTNDGLLKTAKVGPAAAWLPQHQLTPCWHYPVSLPPSGPRL